MSASYRRPTVRLTRDLSGAAVSSSTYTVPAQRAPPPKSYDDEFPSMAVAPAKAKHAGAARAGAAKKSYSTLIKEHVEKDDTDKRVRLLQIGSEKKGQDTDIELIRAMAALPNLSLYLRRRKEREQAEFTRRHRLFDHHVTEEEEEAPYEPEPEPEEQASEGDEENEAYDADEFDRHR
jgi:hypothetical protein